MRQYLLLSLLVIAGFVLVSCGSKKVQEKVVKHIPVQNAVLDMHKDTQNAPDLFADLSLDDIRNNIEFFDTKTVAHDKSVTPLLGAEEQEARLTDIAIPFGARLLNQYADYTNDHNHIVLGYASAMSVADIVSFYIEQMETLGWSCADHIRGYEQLLIFERPGRSCSVVIRSLSHPTRVDSSLTKIVMFLRTS